MTGKSAEALLTWLLAARVLPMWSATQADDAVLAVVPNGFLSWLCHSGGKARTCQVKAPVRWFPCIYDAVLCSTSEAIL